MTTTTVKPNVETRRGYIAGFRLTIHSMERMIERGLNQLDVLDALQVPLFTEPGNKPDIVKFCGSQATVVTDALTREVLTVYPSVISPR